MGQTHGRPTQPHLPPQAASSLEPHPAGRRRPPWWNASLFVFVVAIGLILRDVVGIGYVGKTPGRGLFMVTTDLLLLTFLWEAVIRPLRGATVREVVRAAGVVAGMPDGIVTTDSKGAIQSFNASAERLFGYRAGEVIGRSAMMLLGAPSRAELALLIGTLQAGTGGPYKSHEVPLQGLRRDGQTFPIVLEATGITARGRHLVVCVMRDFTRQCRITATTELLKDLDAHILQNEPLGDVLQHLCERITEVFALPLAWVGLKEPNGTVGVQARAGRAAEFLSGIAITWGDEPEGAGPTGTAIRTGVPQLVDLTQTHDLSPWAERRREFGLRAAFSIPLKVHGDTVGTLSLYGATEDIFSAEVTAQLMSLADQVAISVLAALNQEQLRLQTTALESAANAVLITDSDGRIRWANPAWARLTGLSTAEAVGQSPALLRSGRNGTAYFEQLWRTILAGETWAGLVENRREDGSLYTVDQTITPVRSAAGVVTHFVAISQDVTERCRQEEQIRHLATHDTLTDLPNRRLLMEGVARAVSRARRGTLSALVVLDLDDFKLVNDTLGHATGDQVLLTVANLLRHTLRPSDLFGSLGADEFGVLLEQVTIPEAKEVAERIRRVLGEHRFHLNGFSFDVSVSAGVAVIDAALDAAGVMVLADHAVSAAKEGGKNRTVLLLSDQGKSLPMAEAGQWVSRIKDGLRDQKFLLHFQPVVHLHNGVVDHYEALLRLQSDNGDLIMPAAFLSAAERFGLMPQIDRWVVENVLEKLREQPDLGVFVNLSGQSLGDESLLVFIEERIRESGVTPGRLVFEITETTAVRDLAQTQQWMERLRLLGCRFALDDFGIGFSSFAYLRTLPADFVKIDGSFILNLDQDETNHSLVQAMYTVAHTLGKQVIAEWVESEAVAEVLRGLGVEHGQGYRWGMPAADAFAAPGVPAPQPSPCA